MSPDVLKHLEVISPFSAYLSSFVSFAAPAWAAILISTAAYWFFLLLPPVAAMNYMDRKLGADIQMRIGPNRVSPFGLFQFLADAIKLFFKEDIGTNSRLLRWGPLLALICVFMALGNIPIGDSWALSNLDSGLLIIICALMLSHLWIIWAAYSADTVWSVLSCFRMITLGTLWLVPLVLSLVPPVLIAGSINLKEILHAQGGAPWRWLAFHNPGSMLSFVTLFCSMHVWQGRRPLDYDHAGEEIRGGLMAEYSGLRRGLFTFMEYSSFFLSCALVVALYLGGGNSPFDLESLGRAGNIVQWLFFMAKVLTLGFISIWIRWSLPRLRIDQIIHFSWQVLIPAGMVGAIVTALWCVFTRGHGMGELL